MEVLYAIVAANVIMSWKGFSDYAFFERYKFDIYSILGRKEQVRMLSSGFLHIDYMHLGFNMFAFYVFGEVVFYSTSIFQFLAIYFGSLIGGNLLSLYIHRNHEYSAVGASGAVSGIIYSAIILDPQLKLTFILFPVVSIPGWLFGIGYMLYSIFGIKSQHDNIGHEAHLGGALTGLLATILFLYNTVPFNYMLVAAIVVPTVIFLYFVVYHPEWLHAGVINWGNSPFAKWWNSRKKSEPGNTKPGHTVDRNEELNRLLDKVNKVGYDGLTDKEKQRLDELSK
jgi:membrane associated rhomboid family serine protease